MNSEIRKELQDMGEDSIRDLTAKLVPGQRRVIGIRVPKLRKLALSAAKTMGEAALDGEDIYYEETMLRGMVIGYLKIPDERRFELIRDFVPLIDNWAVCDSFCPTLRFTKKCSGEMWDFLQTYLCSHEEFYVRFGIVMLMDYYISGEYISRTLESIVCADTGKYYSSMAAAWALAECIIHFPEKSEPYLSDSRLDIETRRRTVRKLCDSFRISDEKKREYRSIIK